MLSTSAALFFLFTHTQLAQQLTTTRDKRPTELKRFAFRLDSTHQRLERRSLLLRRRRRGLVFDHRQRFVQARGDIAEPGANKVGCGRLDRGFHNDGRSRSGGLFIVSDERIVDKVDAALFVVHPHVQLATTSAAHDVSLDLFFVKGAFKSSILEGCNEGEEVGDFEGGVDL